MEKTYVIFSLAGKIIGNENGNPFGNRETAAHAREALKSAFPNGSFAIKAIEPIPLALLLSSPVINQHPDTEAAELAGLPAKVPTQDHAAVAPNQDPAPPKSFDPLRLLTDSRWLSRPKRVK